MPAVFELQPTQYRLQGNWVHFPQSKLDPVQIPFGLLAGVRPRPRIRVETTKRKVTGLWVEIGGAWRVVLPTFSCRVAINKSHASHILIEVATTDEQRTLARGIVKRGHYLNPRNGGLILLASIGGRIVGTLQIERLMHGHPFGRKDVYRAEGFRPPGRDAMKRPGFRRRVVDRLGLYWISRVAVERRFRSQGVGSVLCDAAREVVARWMPEPGRYLELIRRMPVADFDAIRQGRPDFLTGRSYRLRASLAYTLRIPYLSRKGDTCLAYYFSRAGRMVIPTTARTAPRWRGHD